LLTSSAEAIYQEEFEILADGTWRIGLPEHGCKVKVKVDSRYPDTWLMCWALLGSVFFPLSLKSDDLS